MLTIITFLPAFGEISASPFSVKALCLLEMSGLDYTHKVMANPSAAPKKKLPILDHDGKTIPDSDQIRDYLEDQLGADFDKGLSAEQRAISQAVIRMTEESIYFAIMCTRWQDDDNWPITREELFGGIPKLLRNFITGKIRKQALRTAYGQGMGRHTPAEQAARVGKDLEAIKVLLGDKPFLFGDQPTAADASVVPMLRGITSFPRPTLLKDEMTARPTLMSYIERGKSAMFPS